MSAASVQIQTSKFLSAWSTSVVAQRREFRDSQAAALDALGEQIATGARRLERTRSKVVYLFDQVQHDPMRNRLAHRAVVQADRKLALVPVAPTGWGDL